MRISIITQDRETHQTGCFYPQDEEEIPIRCSNKYHKWKTYDGKPPADEEYCLCEQVRYVSG